MTRVGDDGQLVEHEVTYIKPDGESLRVVAANREQVEAFAQQVIELEEFSASGEPLPTPAEIAESLQQLLSVAVSELCDLLRGHDAFDVMAMVRQYIFPPDMALYRESGSTVDSSWASAEVIALALLGLGAAGRAAECETRTAAIIPEAIARAAHLVTLADAEVGPSLLAGDDPELARLAWALRSHETRVRGRQYSIISSQINTAILQRQRAIEIWSAELKYTPDDVLAVRKAAIDLVTEQHDRARDRLASAVQGESVESVEPPTHLLDFLEAPGKMSTVTAAQVAAAAGLDVDTAELILNAFSAAEDGRSPLQLIQAFTSGRNPLVGKGILRRGQDYLMLPGAIALDEIRRTCEPALKARQKAWNSYDRQRAAGAEERATQAICQLTRNLGRLWTNVKFRAPTKNNEEVDLSGASTTASSAGLAEADLLLVLDRVALCVEVKAGDLRPRTRQGGVAQLSGDLKKTVQEAAEQADRLRTLIIENHGLWLEDGQWLDLGEIHEIHSIAVTLDDLGPVSLMMEQLVRSGILPQTHLPWIVSLHDLIVTSDVLTNPSQFLTYLRRRTNRDASIWITAADELDVLMWFVTGGFYFEPDPDRLAANNPNRRRPTTRERRTYAEQGRTYVGTFTDELDAWYYWREGISSQESPRPSRRMQPSLEQIGSQLREAQDDGWWRLGSDLDGLSEQAQARLADAISEVQRQTSQDGGFHTVVFGGHDNTGSWLIIVASGPNTPESTTHLQTYLRAKKHSVAADRAAGILLGVDGLILKSAWEDEPPGPDPALDRLVREMRLVPPDRMPRVMPPHVRNPRLAKKRKKRR